MKSLVCGLALSFVMILTAYASELPDAPQPQSQQAKPRIFDWPFIAVHSVYAGSLIFDDYTTARGLGQPCGFVEGNPGLGPHPSARRLALHGMAEFAAVTAADAFFKWYGNRKEFPRWLRIMDSGVAASIAAGKHIHGGMAWVNTGCL